MRNNCKSILILSGFAILGVANNAIAKRDKKLNQIQYDLVKCLSNSSPRCDSTAKARIIFINKNGYVIWQDDPDVKHTRIIDSGVEVKIHAPYESFRIGFDKDQIKYITKDNRTLCLFSTVRKDTLREVPFFDKEYYIKNYNQQYKLYYSSDTSFIYRNKRADYWVFRSILYEPNTASYEIHGVYFMDKRSGIIRFFFRDIYSVNYSEDEIKYLVLVEHLFAYPNK